MTRYKDDGSIFAVEFYNRAGQIVRLHEPDMMDVLYEYDQAGRRVACTIADPGNAHRPPYSFPHFTADYSQESAPCRIHWPSSSPPKIETFRFDHAGREIHQVIRRADGPLIDSIHTTYLPDHSVRERYDRRGCLIRRHLAFQDGRSFTSFFEPGQSAPYQREFRHERPEALDLPYLSLRYHGGTFWQTVDRRLHGGRLRHSLTRRNGVRKWESVCVEDGSGNLRMRYARERGYCRLAFWFYDGDGFERKSWEVVVSGGGAELDISRISYVLD
ncbi:MAG: RHS repeat domain-containing protein [Bacteroidota bacterium]